ncbi:MAG: recombinase family protein [Limisphaerales bacterium]
MTAELVSSKPRKRCAVYTRKSTEEGLDQEFNSIDAQRDAGQAYIVSQRAEGWIPVADDYDDPAFSGGNMERPALKRLLADIEAGKIDIVLVYKIDRLTRSLADFSKMVEVFERHGVSFVAVTQQINSATPMGRLMLNVLLSFAQFEREVTGERIRDKIAASKKKGLWMGGRPPLGYDVIQRKLVVNAEEAALVRRIFEDFVTLRSCTRLAAALNAEGQTTKAWTTQAGKVNAGGPFDRKLLHDLLRNRLYRGELSHQGQWYPGQHEPLVDQTVWEQVQAVFSEEGKQRAVETRQRAPSDALLRGLLHDTEGNKLYPTYTRKQGKTYRYYIGQGVNRFGVAGGSLRLPAEPIEAATVQQIKTVLSSPEAVTAVCRELRTEVDEGRTVVALSRLGDVWSQLYPVEQHRLVQLMVERVDLLEQGLRIHWRELGWRSLLEEFSPETIGAEMVAWEAA